MQDDDAQFQYVQGQSRPGFGALLADYEAESAAAAAREDCTLDLRYGPAPRQTFDFFPAHGRARATLLYLHAGYWQSRDKSGFRFIAPPFARAGLNVALANYPLCPDVSLPALVEAAMGCVAPIAAHAAKAAGALPLLVSGHSAGAHLAVEMALRDAPRRDTAIAGVIALSGIFDLGPLVETSLNDKLRLDRPTALACSPQHRVSAVTTPALIAVGAEETPAFVAQSRRLDQAWRAAGGPSVLRVEPGADHFSLLRCFSTPGSALFEKVLACASAN